MNSTRGATERQVQTASTAASGDEYLTSREVETWLGVSLRTIVNLRRRRILPYLQLGRVVRFRRSDVESALKHYTVEGLGTRRGEQPGQPPYNPVAERTRTV